MIMSDVARGDTADRDGTRLLRLRDFALQVNDDNTQNAVGPILVLQGPPLQAALAKPPGVV
ncbi:hypothetical protein CO683_40195 [Bradyrhizobium ottawaense]|nr:hypothetical protein CO683_40195 [Bradyrhizobium ottawaense]